MVNTLKDPNLAPIPVPVLVISLFNGIGGAFRIYDILGVRVAGKISCEIDKEANRVTRTAWPDVEELLDVEDIDYAEVQRWANFHSSVREVHFYVGFPCVHLSALRAFRQNLEGPGSRLFWKLLDILGWVQQIFSQFAKVKFCVGHVASMDPHARNTISECLEVMPVKLDPSDSLPFSRPRFAWCSEPLLAMPGLELWPEDNYVRAWVTEGQMETHQWIRPGWRWNGEDSGAHFRTFMKAIKRTAPPPVPAGLHRATEERKIMWEAHSFRFPPYQYHPKYWLEQDGQAPRLLDSSERELLL